MNFWYVPLAILGGIVVGGSLWLICDQTRPVIREWRRRRRNPPHVQISYHGQRTRSPKVSVNVQSATGSQSVYTHPATFGGNARATLDAKSLAHILQIPLIDRRACDDFHVDFGDWCLCKQREGDHLPERALGEMPAYYKDHEVHTASMDNGRAWPQAPNE